MKTYDDITLTILDDAAVRRCMPTIKEAADLVERAFAVAASGDVDQPLKPYVRPGGREGERARGRLITMPAWLGGEFGALGLKAITSLWTNGERHGLPRASAVSLLFDPDTGLPMVAMEAAALSALRTAAAALFALRKLRAPGPMRVAVLGAGVIGRHVAAGVAELDDVEELVVYDVMPEAAEALAAWARSELGLAARTATDPREALRDAGGVVAATTAEQAYLEPAWFAPGSVFVAVSLVDADPRYMAIADRLVVDDWGQGCREGKPLERMADEGLVSRLDAITFAELASGLPGRGGPHERIYVNPMGVAIEDLAVAMATWRRAAQRHDGVTVNWLQALGVAPKTLEH